MRFSIKLYTEDTQENLLITKYLLLFLTLETEFFKSIIEITQQNKYC